MLLMVYEITMEKELEKTLNELKTVNIKEYTILANKINEMQTHAKIILNHKQDLILLKNLSTTING